jgi:hypothetical protein
MALVRPLVAVTAGVTALVVGGLIWYDRSRPDEKPKPTVAIATPVVTKPAPVPTPPPAIPAAPPAAAAEISEPAPIETRPVAAATPVDREARVTAHREAKDRRLIEARYGKLLDQLNLTPAQREQLTRMLIDQREASADYAGAVATAGVDASEDPRNFNKSVREVRDQLHEQMAALLGDEGYAKFVAGDLAIKQAAVLDRAQSSLQGTGAELTGPQAQQLQGLLQELGVHYVTDDVITRASGFLSDRQIQALEEQQVLRARGANKDRVQKAIRKNKT